MDKILCAIELYDIEKKKDTLYKLKNWVKDALPRMNELYKLFIHEENDLKAHLDFLDARRQIQDMKMYYYEKMDSRDIDTRSVEEIYGDIDLEICIINGRIKEIELYRTTLEKQAIIDYNNRR